MKLLKGPSTLSLFLIFLCGSQLTQAQFSLTSLAEWENPKTIGGNKEPARALSVPYPDIKTVLAVQC